MNPKKDSILAGLQALPSHMNSTTVSSGIVAGIFGWASTLVLYANGIASGWSTEQTISWIFACWVAGPIIGTVLSLKYRLPIPGAWSISGSAIVVSGAAAGFTPQQLCVGFLMSGIVVFLLGVTGLIAKLMHFLPMPIVMGMTAGCLMRFVTNDVAYIYNWANGTGVINQQSLIIGLVSVVVYVFFTKYKEKIKIMPPLLASLLVVIAGVFLCKMYDFDAFQGARLYLPKHPGYDFSNIGAVFVSVSLPLSLLVIGAENAQATGVLIGQGYQPPVKAMTIMSGIGGIMASFFGGHNANIAGPMTAITASPESGEKLESRYAAAVICNAMNIIIGILASIAVPFLNTLPKDLIDLVAGLALIGVILSSLQSAFRSHQLQMSAFFAFFVALSQKAFFGIGSAFWALLVGVLVAATIENNDFKAIILRGEVECE